jgi:uncharacterized membrane protein
MREGGSHQSTQRLEAFSDGVFAIVITLLILEIRVPTGLGAEESLGAALAERWPAYLAFVASFATVGIMWINHTRLFRLIRLADNRLLLLNLLLLLGVCVVPFPTALVAEYIGEPQERTAALVYTGMGVVIAIFFNLLWRHAASRDDLLEPDVDPRAVRAISRSYLFGPVVYLLSVAMAFWNVPGALGVTLALAVFFALPPEWVTGASQ